MINESSYIQRNQAFIKYYVQIKFNLIRLQIIKYVESKFFFKFESFSM